MDDFEKQLQGDFFFLNGRGMQDYSIPLISSLLIFVVCWLVFST